MEGMEGGGTDLISKVVDVHPGQLDAVLVEVVAILDGIEEELKELLSFRNISLLTS